MQIFCHLYCCSLPAKPSAQGLRRYCGQSRPFGHCSYWWTHSLQVVNFSDFDHGFGNKYKWFVAKILMFLSEVCSSVI